MKIAIFSDTYPPQVNGVANVVFQSAIELNRLGHEVRIFTLSESIRNKPAKTVPGIKIITVPSFPALIYPHLRVTAPLGFTLRKLNRFKPDIIHTHTPFAMGWEAVIGARIFKIPIVGTHHTFYDHYLKHIKLDFSYAKKLSWKYMVRYYSECDCLITPSKSLKDAFLKNNFLKPIKVLPNSIDVDFFCPTEKLSSKNKIIVHMGRLSYEKNIKKIIQAFAILRKKEKNVTLMIIGEGPELPVLKKMSQKLNLTKSIIFTGLLRGEKLLKAMQKGDIFTVTSKNETFCLSVLEAMAIGLPIVAVNKNGVRELVKDRVNGFLEKTDQPEGLAKRFLELLRNDELRKSFSQNSRKIALEYSSGVITKQLEKVYREDL